MRVATLPGVFRPRSDSWLLAAHLRAEMTGLPPAPSVLDVCTGSGAIAIAGAQAGAGAVTAVDVSRRSVLTVRINARLNGVRVRALRGDLFAPVAGEVTATNERLAGAPEVVNSDPYGSGWMLRVRLADAAEVDGLLDADAYEQLTAGG